MRKNRLVIVAALLLLCAAPILGQSGSIEGQVTKNGEKGIGGVTVVVSELGLVQITDENGEYAFPNVADGSYNLSFSLGDNADSAPVTVGGGTATVDKSVDWDYSFVDTITVFSASRRRERIVDAPAAVTLVTQEELEQTSATGQVTKVLEFTPGVEVTQSGIFDIQLNARGFNSSLNRRVQPLVDGRDPTVPFLGSTEWQALNNMQDLASVEMVRGPSSALYGANAFNGVLNMTTKVPSANIGGQFRLSGGDLSTIKADLLWATEVGAGWYFKLNANYLEGEDFTLNRTVTTEYPGLPREAAVPSNEYEATSFSLRLDRDFENGNLLTLEGGFYDGEGGTAVTGIGRVNVGEVERPWTRLNFSTDHFNFLAYTNGREAPGQLALASGGRIFLDTENRHAEVQTNWDFNDGKVRFVAGASYEEEEIDTRNGQGIQTLVFNPVEEDFTAVFAQLDFDIGDNLKLVIAGRYDDSSLHEEQFSPKAALVWSVNGSNTLRFSYNEAFQVPNYSEFFLDAPTAFPGPISSIDLSAIEAGLCTPFGVTCGFGSPVRVRALGNVNLEVEEIKGFEIGYSGIFGSKAFLTIDYYNNEIDNFITDLLPNPLRANQPALRRLHAHRPTTRRPTSCSGRLAGALPPTVLPFLTNNVDGTPIFALASYTNCRRGRYPGHRPRAEHLHHLAVGLRFHLLLVRLRHQGCRRREHRVPNAAREQVLGRPHLHRRDLGWRRSSSAGSTTSCGPRAPSRDRSIRYSQWSIWAASTRINDRVELGLNISNLLRRRRTTNRSAATSCNAARSVT